MNSGNWGAVTTGTGTAFGAQAASPASEPDQREDEQLAHQENYSPNDAWRRRGTSATIETRPSRTSCSSTRACR